MNTQKYIIRLQPLGSYFFGGEDTFGEGFGKTYKYLANSEIMPQAGTLIGMLRYEILRRSGALDGKVPREKWPELIGEQSFSIDAALSTKESFNFGLISAISPVFLCDNNGQYYTPMPMDRDTIYNKEKGRSYYAGHIREHVVGLEKFDPKTYRHGEKWVDTKGQPMENSPFIFSERPGIIKNENYRKKDDEDSYHKQKVVSLRKGFGFVFQLETPADHALFDEERKCFVNMGADRSMFAMSIEPCTNTFSLTAQFSALADDKRCLLLGDTFLPEQISCADFIWGEMKNSRSILSKTSETHSWNCPKKSDLFHLLKPGCTIYGDKQSIEECLNIENLRIAGLNHCI